MPTSSLTLLPLLAAALVSAAQLEISSSPGEPASVIFIDSANNEMNRITGGEGGSLNSSSRLLAPDFVTSDGLSSLDALRRRLDATSCPACNCPAPAGDPPFFVSTGQASGNPPPGKTWIAWFLGAYRSDAWDSSLNLVTYTSTNAGSGWVDAVTVPTSPNSYQPRWAQKTFLYTMQYDNAPPPPPPEPPTAPPPFAPPAPIMAGYGRTDGVIGCGCNSQATFSYDTTSAPSAASLIDGVTSSGGVSLNDRLVTWQMSSDGVHNGKFVLYISGCTSTGATTYMFAYSRDRTTWTQHGTLCSGCASSCASRTSSTAIRGTADGAGSGCQLGDGFEVQAPSSPFLYFGMSSDGSNCNLNEVTWVGA